MKIYSLEEVFGISRSLPLNYVSRNHVDDIFKECLEKKQHIVIYGSSKQGKTCLRKKCLPLDSFITVHCSSHLDLAGLNQSILKAAGFEIVSSHNKTIGGKAKAKATFGFNFFTKLNIETGLEGSLSNQTTTNPLELDLDDSNDIIRALQSINFNKYVILDDFHYLTPKTQKEFAFALKSFFENSDYIFIVVGVWLEKNRLIALNGDLAGRVISIDAEHWSQESLKEVIAEGERLLNFNLSEDLIDTIIEQSYDNVYIVQEICYRICQQYGIKHTLVENFFISNGQFDTTSGNLGYNDKIRIVDYVKEIIDQHNGRYNSFLLQFSDGFQNSDIETYRWLLYPIVSTDVDNLINGLTFNQIKDCLKQKHPKGEDLNLSNLLTALNSLTYLQLEKNITPNIIDFDQTNMRLNIVDREFIIWLSLQDHDKLFSLIGFNKEQ